LKIGIVFVLVVVTATLSMSSIVSAHEHQFKYSEVVNVSVKDFAASINNNVSGLIHDIELASKSNDYETIVKLADLMQQNDSLAGDMFNALNSAGLYEEADWLYQAQSAIFDKVASGTPINDIISDARKRMEEKYWENVEAENARIAEQTRSEEPAVENVNTTSAINTTSFIPNKGFGNYTFDGQDEVSVTVKKGTDVVHMMASVDIPTDYGHTKDGASYTVTSTGHKIKGFIDYTLDGYVMIMKPRSSSLTKGEFMDMLDTFQRTD
jgi:hypothetical protein